MRYFVYFCHRKSNVSVNEQGTWHDERLEKCLLYGDPLQHIKLKVIMDCNKTCKILCIISIIATTVFAQKPKYKSTRVKTKCSYVIEQNRYDDAPILKWEFDHDQDIVSDAKSAATLAYVYAVNLYGEKMAKNEQPYTVNSLNDSIWEVLSAQIKPVKHAKWKGGFYMLIEKKTGKLRCYMHEK